MEDQAALAVQVLAVILPLQVVKFKHVTLQPVFLSRVNVICLSCVLRLFLADSDSESSSGSESDADSVQPPCAGLGESLHAIGNP